MKLGKQRLILFWLPPITLGISVVAILEAMLSPGGALALTCLILLVGFGCVALVLLHRFYCWIADLHDERLRRREDRPGFQVIVKQKKSDPNSN